MIHCTILSLRHAHCQCIEVRTIHLLRQNAPHFVVILYGSTLVPRVLACGSRRDLAICPSSEVQLRAVR